MYLGRHVVNIDFQLLGLESDLEIDVIMTGCRPAMSFFIGARISVQYILKKHNLKINAVQNLCCASKPGPSL
jgi:hypothetical protein